MSLLANINLRRLLSAAFLPASALLLAAGLSGCASTAPDDFVPHGGYVPVSTNSESIILSEGDIVRVTFPGAPNLDSIKTIQRDGKITMPNVGEVVAAGKTAAALRDELLALYAPDLVVKQVQVSVESSAFPIFVTGSVQNPGKITANRPTTVLEAIMECGGPDYTRANLKNVKIIRNNEGRLEHHRVNVRRILDGSTQQPFYLKPSDIIYVPERFSWL